VTGAQVPEPACSEPTSWEREKPPASTCRRFTSLTSPCMRGRRRRAATPMVVCTVGIDYAGPARSQRGGAIWSRLRLCRQAGSSARVRRSAWRLGRGAGSPSALLVSVRMSARRPGPLAKAGGASSFLSAWAPRRERPRSPMRSPSRFRPSTRRPFWTARLAGRLPAGARRRLALLGKQMGGLQSPPICLALRIPGSKSRRLVSRLPVP
jgi:hypothetical protein